MESATLRTERLELRSVRDEGIDRILEYRNLPEVTHWLLRTEVEPASFRAAWLRDDPPARLHFRPGLRRPWIRD